MSTQGPDLPDLVGELAQTTAQLREELATERRGPMRPPRPGELVRFTSEVTIPALVLLLETNVRALRLLQRTLRFAQGRADEPETAGSGARKRAEDLGRETLGRLDSALADLQDALSGRPPDDEARQLLDEARELRGEVERRLEESASQVDESSASEGEESRTEGIDQAADSNEVPVDVDAELQSIKDDVDDSEE